MMVTAETKEKIASKVRFVARGLYDDMRICGAAVGHRPTLIEARPTFWLTLIKTPECLQAIERPARRKQRLEPRM
jgi:hypothetical protein